MIYVYIQNKKYLKKIQYVFDNVFFNLGLEYKYIYDEVIDINDEDILVTYSFNDDEIEFYDLFKNHIDIKDSLKLFNDDYYMKYNVLTNIEIKKVRLYDKYDLISLFSKEKEVYLNILEDNENTIRSEEHTSELQSRQYLVCRLLLEKKKQLIHPLPTLPFSIVRTSETCLH